MLRNNFILGVLLGTLIGGTLAFLFMQDSLRKTRSHFFRLEEDKEIHIADSLKRLDQTGLLRNMLDKLDDELRDSDRRSLSDETIDRIAAMCYVFKPYRYAGSDTTASKKLSPERGQLLLFLVSMHLDSGSYQQIFSKADFSNADLRNADLRNSYLSGINLRNAFLQNANLEGTNLNGANLRTADLFGVNLIRSRLNHANLEQAELNWAIINESDMRKSVLNGADLSSAQLRRCNLSEAVLEWTVLTGAFLNDANLASANLFRTKLNKANLQNADLSSSEFIMTDLKDANLSNTIWMGAEMQGIELHGATVRDANWFELLRHWNVKGVQEVNKRFKLSTKATITGEYRLEKL